MKTDRLNAFTDGVVAIIITIMVLELPVPKAPGMAALRPELTLFGPDAGSVVVPETEGLRITPPANGKQTRGWGVALR